MSEKKIITIFIGILASIILFVFPSVLEIFNTNIENSFYSIHGESKPDSNIIIIHVTTNDIESLGDWPLKRSYYALLIDNLTNLEVKNIGIEIFLSQNVASQNIYNNALNQSIEKSGKVVLASLAEGLIYNNGVFYSENILYPSSKKQLKDVATGHINFVTNKGFLIPSQINTDTGVEFSFVSSLSGNFADDSNLKVNFISSWHSFTNYSILDFFEMLEKNDRRLTHFKDKIILVGVSDPLIAKTISSYFDKDLPGLGMHALALDNILNDRMINYQYVNLSKYFFIILVLILAFSQFKNFLLISISVFGFFLFFVLWHTIQLQLDYGAFFIPILIIIVFNFIYGASQSKKKLNESLNESAILQRNLLVKEEKLQQLKAELTNQKSNSKEGLEIKIDELEREIKKLKSIEEDDKEYFKTKDEPKIFEGIVYKSNKMAKIVDTVKKVSPEDAAVLVLGESGSGKELIANAIHKLSKRSNHNFVVVNCAAMPDTLLESELFGHVKGAFTDAIKDKIGRFEEANNGTLFLDEIGETSENFQVKLLRVLQSGDFQKVGSSKTEHVDVRIVAATNKNLHKLVREHEFREDLYYRLNVISIELPRLVDRSEDIEILAEYFAKRDDPEIHFSKAVMRKFSEHEWKGNIRELESTIQRACIFAKSDNRKIIKLKDLPDHLSRHDKDELESLILDSLREKRFSHSSINETAKELGGINRTIISENFRGIFFRFYTQNNFDIKKSVKQISNTDNEKINSKVESKVKTYLSNIEKDLSSTQNQSFDDVKNKFISKYKNLPQKYHNYLDIIIKNFMKN